MRLGKSKIRKFMALVVCAALIGGSLPGVVFAEAGDGTDIADIVEETVSGKESSVNEGSSVTVESSGGGKKETSHKAVETASNAANPVGEDYIVETLSNAIKPLADGVWQIEGKDETYLTFADALEDAKTGDTIILLGDTEENITVTSGSEVTLDLNDNTLSAEDKKVSVVTIEEGAELTLTDSGTDGCITGGEAQYGGGIYNIGTLTMYGGTVSGNKSSYAGGVYNIGTFYMYDGSTISDNTALSWGGGVITGILPGEIDNGSSFTMYGGIITGNEGSDWGGGVAICSCSTFNMIDGTISNNTSNAGAGVLLYSGSFNMKGGEICENNGTGVYNVGTFNMTGGTISKNSIGVNIEPGCTIYLSGSPVIADNTSCNVVSLYSSSRYTFYITLSGDLEEGASIGVTPSTAPTEDTPVQITDKEDSTEYYKTSAQYFFYDGDSSYVGTPNEAGQYVELAKEHVASLEQNGTTTEYISVQAAVNAAGNTEEGTVTMLMDSTENITIASGQDITLDLAGYTLDGGQNDSVITNEGTLTLVDSSGDDSGLITGGSSYYGGGVYNVGTFNMTGGTISGNNANGYGGGAYIADGTFHMTGGIITGNTASVGGGVCLSGYAVCYITGGKLCNNTASGRGADFGTEIAGGCFATILKASDMMGNSDSDHCYNWYLDNSLFGRYSYPDNITDKYTNSSVIGSSSPGHLTSTVELILAGDEGHLYNEEDVTFTWDGTESCTATFICADCEHEESVKCDVTSVIVTEPDCTDEGFGIYTATATITNRDGTALSKTDSKEETIPELGHEWDEGVVTKEATCTDDGITTYTCTRCDATKTEQIKALGHEWEVEQTVIEDSEDRYEERVGMKCTRCGLEYEEEIVVSTESDGTTAHSSLSWSDLISADELAQLFEADAELDFKMTAEAIAESDVPSTDRTLAEDLIAAQWPDADYTASWLDISVLLDITHKDGSEETREYSSTLNPVTITVAIPDELLNADGDSYAVIRIHDGEAAVLDTTDNGDGTITFASDLFSSYAIVKTSTSETSDTGDEGDTGETGTSGTGTSGSGSSSHSDNDDNDYNNSSSTTGSSEGQNVAYVKGTWTIDEYGYWRFTSDTGKRYENEWGYIYNPYADVSIGQPEASWFHFGDDGIMDTGWYTDTDGYIYYLNPELDNTQGRMFTGWNWIKAGDGRNLCYYFDESLAGGHYGRLYISTTTPDGYTVDETGAWIENGEQVTR